MPDPQSKGLKLAAYDKVQTLHRKSVFDNNLSKRNKSLPEVNPGALYDAACRLRLARLLSALLISVIADLNFT